MLELDTAPPAVEPDPSLPVLGVHDGPRDLIIKAPGISKSGLDKIHKCPARYIFEKKHPRPPTPALIFGNALHCLVLEPDDFSERYIKDAYPGRQTKEAKEWREGQKESGLIVINSKADASKGEEWGASDWDQLHRMAESVRSHPIAWPLLDGARTELTMFWIDRGTRKLCKGKIDAYSDSHCVMMDLKSADDASFSGVQRSVHEYRYDVQDAFYQDGGTECDLRVDGFVFIFVEKTPPYFCACYAISPEWRRQGRIKYQHDIEVYKRCSDTGEWPSYEPMRDLEMPGYATFNKIG